MTGQITARMQHVDDNDFVWPVEKHKKALYCPRERQNFVPLNHDRSISAENFAVCDGLTPGDEL